MSDCFYPLNIKRFVMKWFKKKQKVVDTNGKQLKIGDYKLKLTIRAMCLFEQLTGKSFMAMDDTDMIDLLYAMFVTSNDSKMSKAAFEILIQDENVLKWMAEEYKRQSKFDNQLKFFSRVDDAGLTKEEIDKERHDDPIMISSIAGMFISHGIDANYVMNTMELWEIDMYAKALEDQRRERLESDRLFTWISIMPHLDKKSAAKLKNPSDLLPFPWDEDVKVRKQKTLENNAKAAMAFLGQKPKKDGE